MDGYKFQRTMIGVLGIALGFICIFGGMIQSNILQSSISAYYHTNVRDIFVGVLMVSSLFLFAYKGYDSIDFITSNIAGVTALGISIFPCLPINYEIGGKVGFFQLGYLVSNALHLICAGIFFCSLIYIILFLFTKSGIGKTINKVRRNLIYLVCGSGMIVGLILVIISNIIGIKMILIGEMIMLILYGIAWLVKGEVILRDEDTIS